MEFTLTGFIQDFAIMSGLMLVGMILRAKIKFFQNFYVPVAMIAGILGILGGKYMLNIIPFSSQASSYSGFLFYFLFATLFLGKEGGTKSGLSGLLKRSGDSVCLNNTAYAGFYGVAAIISATALTALFPGLHSGFGVLAATGFAGGHGSAAAVGTAFVNNGWEEGVSVAQTFATIGLLCGIFGGVGLIKFATKRNYTKVIDEIGSLPEDMKTGLVQVQNRTALATETVNTMSLDSLTWHVLLVVAATGAGMAFNAQVVAKLLPSIVLPDHIFTLIFGALLFFLLSKIGLGDYVDKQTINRIGSSITDYYTTLISGKTNWTMTDIYADAGISGTSAQKRPDFQRLLSDCRRGRVDKILVKSISRFARNAADCLETIRELKAIGVGVCFEEQGIDTSEMSGELLTAMFSALAQKESESISGNMRWSYQARMKKGTFLPSSVPFGYQIKGREIVIDEERAKIVKCIFDRYLEGQSMDEIAAWLNREKIAVRIGMENRKWIHSAISYILSNERYCIKNGKTCVEENAADTVRMIFRQYIQGASYQKLANVLEQDKIPYIAGKRWNKNIIARILKDIRYTGDEKYPPIIAQDMFRGAAESNEWSCTSPERVKFIKNMRALVRCPLCGGIMFRNIRANWRCPDCMDTSVKVADEALERSAAEVLRQLGRTASNMEIPDASSEMETVQGLEDELLQALNQTEFDEAAAKGRAMALASARFNALGSEDFETMRIQYILTRTEQNGDLDTELLRQITSAILIHPNGAVSLKLKNGQIIERTDTT